MTSEAKDSSTMLPESSYSSGSGNQDSADFECHICFELAQDPVVTSCGHLYCWPCLFQWLRLHSQAQECPVCKALILEEKVIPLYGRGKMSTDPRSKPMPGLEIPNRPAAGQRPETASRVTGVTGLGDDSNFSLRFLRGFLPMASFGNYGRTASFGAPMALMFAMLFSEYFGGGTHGAAPPNGGGSDGLVYGDDTRRHREGSQEEEDEDDSNLKSIFFLVIGCLLLAFLFGLL